MTKIKNKLSAAEIQNLQRRVMELEQTINSIKEHNRLYRQSLLNDRLATVSRLAAGIIHEINNPMTWVLANLHFLRKKFKKLPLKNTEEFDEIIKDIIQGAEKIRDIVTDLKGISRFDDPKLATPIDLHEILISAIAMASFQYKNIARIEKEFSVDNPKLFFNKTQLHQVFLNLILNSMQAFSKKSNKNLIYIKTCKEKNKIRIDICDNGVGISAEIMPKIYEPFFTTKPQGIGTGLGLSICHDILNRQGGEISVKNLPGEGTTFSIFLPLQTNKNKKRILIVDDEPLILKSLKRILEENYNVTIASKGQTALELLKQNENEQFDLIISDVTMPDVTGADLFNKIALQFPGLEHNIIFMTGYAYSAKLKQFLAGIDNKVITKPFEEESLLQTINNFFCNNTS